MAIKEYDCLNQILYVRQTSELLSRSRKMKRPAKPRLILIDGLPGMGKTTTVANLKKALENGNETHAIFCHEYDHPLHAFWTWGDGYDPNEKVMEPYRPDKFIARLMQKTYAFVDQMLTDDMLAVVEAYPFQSPVRNILKMMGTERDCEDYFSRFCDAVSFTNPLLVYFEHPDWKARIQEIEQLRGESFRDFFYEAVIRSPYARTHGVTSREGVIQFYEHYVSVCRKLLGRWPFALDRFNPIEIGQEATVVRILSLIREQEIKA